VLARAVESSFGEEKAIGLSTSVARSAKMSDDFMSLVQPTFARSFISFRTLAWSPLVTMKSTNMVTGGDQAARTNIHLIIFLQTISILFQQVILTLRIFFGKSRETL
jgi:hypothetical protein